MRCSECGFKSDFADFFRRERGGWLNGSHTVCEACEPYILTPGETYWAARQIMYWTAILLITAVVSLQNLDNFAFPLCLGLGLIVTMPVSIFFHEFGHAIISRMTGQPVVRVRVGRGPPWAYFRLFDISFDIRRYSWMGGVTNHGLIESGVRGWKLALIAVAGPAANLVTGGYVLCYVIRSGIIGAIGGTLIGFAIINFFVGIRNLIPQRKGLKTPTDGYLLINAFKVGAVSDADAIRCGRVASLLEQRQWRRAVMYANGWHLSPRRAQLAAAIVRGISRSRGDQVAVDFWLQHESLFERLADIDIPRVEIRAAACALRLSNPALAESVERAVNTWWTVFPDDPEFAGTYGAWLVSVGRADEGVSYLTTALRKVDDGCDRAGLCRFLAEGWRQQGDMARAETYLALQKRYLGKTTS